MEYELTALSSSTEYRKLFANDNLCKLKYGSQTILQHSAAVYLQTSFVNDSAMLNHILGLFLGQL